MFDSWWRNGDVGSPEFSEWPHNCFDGIDNDGNGYVDDCMGYVRPDYLQAHAGGTKSQRGTLYVILDDLTL